VNTNDQISITANASESATLTLKIGGNPVSEVVGTTTLSYMHTVTETSGSVTVTCDAVAGANSKSISFTYTVRAATVMESRPPGIIDGINYSNDHTKVTLSLWAPDKTSVYVFGDFANHWSGYQMKKDGEHFWTEISGLTPGVEYSYQYLVDETIYLADPYADKILDPADQYIPAESYPNLKPYPAEALSAQDYKNRVAVLQTNQTPYAWQTVNYVKPKKESLVIYELLLRDFFANGKRNYQTLIDTLPYFKRLGINAIELMPIMEFNGNESWGYNPTFMFAPDKYYGTKNKLKEFIDKAHQNGIAVILDIVMNQQDIPNSYAVMDYNFTTFKPNPTNKWFNAENKHPYYVFFDLNHESSYTKAYLDTVNHYWLNEYKIDGYRFDLAKGFTQNNKCGGSTTDENCFAQYDASRITILKRMADEIWSHSPDAYVILELFAENSEEKELAEYKADQGKGMMIWGNLNYSYNQNTMGYSSNSDITWIYHGSRSWSVPGVVGYMESHDEERLMYRNLQSGAVFESYNVKNLNTALSRMKAASAYFYTIPGPKMLWEFGELGFDLSINRCEDGSINNGCRLSNKPPHWDYLDVPERYSLFQHNADLIRMKKAFNVFQNGTATFSSNNFLKQISIKNKNYTTTPTDSTQMSAVVAVNFDLQPNNIAVNFPHPGTWYNYYTHEPVSVTGATSTVLVEAGGFRIYTNVEITNPLLPPIVTGISDDESAGFEVFPNPVSDFLETSDLLTSVSLVTATGVKVNLPRVSDHVWDARLVQPGFYIAIAEKDGAVLRTKIIKK
jgi:1,4-alpha-glucan branching enzyme